MEQKRAHGERREEHEQRRGRVAARAAAEAADAGQQHEEQRPGGEDHHGRIKIAAGGERRGGEQQVGTGRAEALPGGHEAPEKHRSERAGRARLGGCGQIERGQQGAQRGGAGAAGEVFAQQIDAPGRQRGQDAACDGGVDRGFGRDGGAAAVMVGEGAGGGEAPGRRRERAGRRHGQRVAALHREAAAGEREGRAVVHGDPLERAAARAHGARPGREVPDDQGQRGGEQRQVVPAAEPPEPGKQIRHNRASPFRMPLLYQKRAAIANTICPRRARGPSRRGAVRAAPP